MTAPTRWGRGLDARAELEDKRGFLLRSLEDLEAERQAGDISDTDYRSLHEDYTARAAAVLRALDEAEAPAPRPPRPRRGTRVLAVLVIVALAGSAALAVVAASGTRTPGGTITGEVPQTSAGRLAQAAGLAQQGQVTEALRLYDEVLAGDPDNLEALSERGLLLVSLASATDRPALAEQGRASIEAALEVDADNARALFYLGLSLRLEGDDAKAADAFTAALAADPPPALRQAMEDFLGSIAAAEPGASPPSEEPSAPAP